MHAVITETETKYETRIYGRDGNRLAVAYHDKWVDAVNNLYEMGFMPGNNGNPNEMWR